MRCVYSFFKIYSVYLFLSQNIFYLFSPLNPLLCIVQVCNAYTELNDPIVQRERFAEQLKVLYMFSRAIQSVLNVLFVICSSLMLVWISGSRIRRWWSNGFGWDILYGSWVWVASDCWLGSRHRSAGYVAYWLTKYQGMWILSLSAFMHTRHSLSVLTISCMFLEDRRFFSSQPWSLKMNLLLLKVTNLYFLFTLFVLY